MIKNRLKTLRHQHEMNQTEFAAFLGLNRNQYNRYERQHEQPGLETALMMSEKLGVPVNAIFYITSE